MVAAVERELLDAGTLEPVKTIARRKTGRTPSPSATWRWTSKGTKQGVLPSVSVYGAPHTTEAAFMAWLRGDLVHRERDPELPSASDDALQAAGLL